MNDYAAGFWCSLWVVSQPQRSTLPGVTLAQIELNIRHQLTLQRMGIHPIPYMDLNKGIMMNNGTWMPIVEYQQKYVAIRKSINMARDLQQFNRKVLVGFMVLIGILACIVLL